MQEFEEGLFLFFLVVELRRGLESSLTVFQSILFVLLHRLIKFGIGLRKVLQLFGLPIAHELLSLLIGDILHPTNDISFQLFFLFQSVFANGLLLHDLAVGFLDDEMVRLKFNSPSGYSFQEGTELRSFFFCNVLCLFLPSLRTSKIPVFGFVSKMQRLIFPKDRLVHLLFEEFDLLLDRGRSCILVGVLRIESHPSLWSAVFELELQVLVVDGEGVIDLLNLGFGFVRVDLE